MITSNSTKPRVIRKHFPKQVIRRTTYRQVLDSLVLDFDDRCAYSMQHSYRANGSKSMEVDHFNPRRKRDPIQEYENLFLATRHCNGAKRDRWPSLKDQRTGLRFLNCCLETDYGVHIFEDPDSHEVVGVTPEGKYHVRNCDLNAPHLIEERKERAGLWRILNFQPIKIKGDFSLPSQVQALKDVAKRMIPIIPFLTGSDLKNHRALKKALSAINGQ